MRTLGEYRAASVLAAEAQAEFVLAVALGVAAALSDQREARRLLQGLSPFAEALAGGRVVSPAVLQAAGIGVRFVRRNDGYQHR